MTDKSKVTTDNRDVLSLYESFTDKEYDESKCMHYSTLKDLHHNPSILLQERPKVTKEWFTFGTVVDTILTKPREELFDIIRINDKVPSEQFLNISNYIIKNDLLDTFNISDVKNFDPDKINEIYTQSGSQVNWGYDTKVRKIIENCGDYIDLLLNHSDKLIISTEVYNEAMKVAGVFSNHKWSRDLFLSHEDQKDLGIELVYQYKIKYLYKGVLCKSKLDVIRIDHNLKTISIFDIKTGSDLPETFARHSLYKFKYGYQGVLYSEGLETFVNKLDMFSDYTLDDFTFVYVSRLKPYYPLVLQMGEECYKEFKETGIDSELYNIPPLDFLFEELAYYMDIINVGETPIEPYELSKDFGLKILGSYSSQLPF